MRLLSRSLLPALALVVLALLGAGCGGGEVAAGEVPGNPPALTVPSDAELTAGGAASDDDSADADADSGAAADSAEPTPEATAAPEEGAAAPEATAAPEDATAEQEQPAEEPATEQFESFCEQNEGAC